jgi:hypothetical protein
VHFSRHFPPFRLFFFFESTSTQTPRQQQPASHTETEPNLSVDPDAAPLLILNWPFSNRADERSPLYLYFSGMFALFLGRVLPNPTVRSSLFPMPPFPPSTYGSIWGFGCPLTSSLASCFLQSLDRC